MLVVYGNSYEDTPTMGLFIRTLIYSREFLADWDGTSWEPSFGSPLEPMVGVRREKGWKRKKVSMQKRCITVTPDFRPTALNWALFSLDAHRSVGL